VLVALSGEGARGQDLVGERDEEDAGRRRHEVDDVLQRRSWNVEARQPCGNRADDRHAVGLQVERPREPDRGDDDHERRRQPWHDVAKGEENPSATAATASVTPLTLPSSRTTSQSCDSGLRASIESPSSFPSWPMTRTTATPWM
jgi:hypothetical protein